MDEYDLLWGSHGGSYGSEDAAEYILDDLAALADILVSKDGSRVRKYDAILVDEGQDFRPEWWNTLRKVLVDDGEAFLVADSTQDIYGVSASWTDDAMRGAGFSGQWAQLDESYRLPEQVVPFMQSYAERYLPEQHVNLPLPVKVGEQLPHQSAFDLEPVQLRWVQTDKENLVHESFFAIMNLNQDLVVKPISVSDITFLTSSRHIGQRCADLLEERGLKVAHIFDQNKKAQRAKKLAFFMGDERIKGSTIHSFKGWESRAVVVIVDNIRSAENKALLYVAMTRLKRSTSGSVLTVVCAEPELEEYGRTWPSFERRIAPAGID